MSIFLVSTERSYCLSGAELAPLIALPLFPNTHHTPPGVKAMGSSPDHRNTWEEATDGRKPLGKAEGSRDGRDGIPRPGLPGAKTGVPSVPARAMARARGSWGSTPKGNSPQAGHKGDGTTKGTGWVGLGCEGFGWARWSLAEAPSATTRTEREQRAIPVGSF